METYDLLDANGYFVFRKDDKNILVDTGAPVTISRDSAGGTSALLRQLRDLAKNLPMFASMLDNMTDNQLFSMLRSSQGQTLAGMLGIDIDSILGASANDAAKLFGVDFEEISTHVGHNIDLIMGNDQLQEKKILIDHRNKKISFCDEDIPFDGINVLCQLSGNYLIVKPKINGTARKVFFDTGAPTSYVKQEWMNGCNQVGTCSDFHPLVGSFETPIYSVPVEFAGKNGNVEIGILPDKLQTWLELQGNVLSNGTAGVIGRSFFTGDSMLIDIAGRVIRFG